MTTTTTDGSPAAASTLSRALLGAVEAVDGAGAAVLPHPAGGPAPHPSFLEPVDDAVAVLVATSGSTGTPKAVLLPGSALRASASAAHSRLGGPARWLLALPAHHVAGVQVLLRSALAGDPAAVMDLREGFRADGFAAITRTAGAAYTSLVPTQLGRLLDDAEGLAALRSFAAVLLGGAATAAPLLARARDLGVAVVTTYGMSETCGGCVYDGVPLDGVGIDLEDDGRIRLGGAVVAAGYRGAESDDFLPGRWFRTSDLGARSADGRLEVLGRADDVIVSGGENIEPALVERALLALPGVWEACVVGIPDAEWGARVVAAVTGAGLDPGAVRDAVAPALGRATPRTVTVLDALPVRGIGKPDRGAVRALLSP